MFTLEIWMCYLNVLCSALKHLVLGCYPRCPLEQPYLEESTMKCVQKEQCGCYVDGKHYGEGDVIPSVNNCYTWYLYRRNTVTKLNK